MGTVDPAGYVGRIIWRWYVDEDPERPWVEGFLIDYDAATGHYTILYDPHHPEQKESTESGFDFAAANPNEYVLGEYFDLETTVGSRRVEQRPAPVTVGPAAVTAPSKRRRTSSIKVPDRAPFPPAWFEGALAEASADDLNIMLGQLDRKELQVAAALEAVEMEMLLGDDLKKRADLEAQFADLCRKEDGIMRQLTEIRTSEQ